METSQSLNFSNRQQNCYEETWEWRDCNNTGQYGEFQSGLPYNEFRFKEDADFVYDNVTQLTWLKDANSNIDMLNWQGALKLVEKMKRESSHGHNDWRLPQAIGAQVGHHPGRQVVLLSGDGDLAIVPGDLLSLWQAPVKVIFLKNNASAFRSPL